MVDLARPSILHWDFNRFVVLVAADKRGITVHDPARGVRRLSMAEASRHFTGVALELQPTLTSSRRASRKRVRLRDLLGRVTGWRRAATQVLVLALALEVFAIISPFYLQWIVDGVLPSADRDLLLVLGVGFVLLMMVQQAIRAARSWVVLYVSTLLNFQWLTNVFTHLLKLPPVFFERRHLGDVYSRFQATSTIQRTLTNSFVEAILDGVMSVITLLMMLIYSVPLALILGCGGDPVRSTPLGLVSAAASGDGGTDRSRRQPAVPLLRNRAGHPEHSALRARDGAPLRLAHAAGRSGQCRRSYAEVEPGLQSRQRGAVRRGAGCDRVARSAAGAG